MHKVKRISRNTMNQISGMPQPGYADSQTNTVYIANDLNKDASKIVMEHEKKHIQKGETDGFWGAIIGAAGSLLGGAQANQAASEQNALNAQATENASQRQLEMQRRSMEELQRQYELARRDTLAGRTTGINALNFLNSALLPGGYQGYVDPSIAFTPDYLQPIRYDSSGGTSTFNPGNEADMWGFAKDSLNPVKAFKNSLDPAREIKRSLAPFGITRNPDSTSASINQYDPGQGTRIGNYDSGQGSYTQGFAPSGDSLRLESSPWDRGVVGPSKDSGSNVFNQLEPPPWERGTVGPGHPSQQNQPQNQPPQGSPQLDFMPRAFDPGEFTADPGYAFRVSEGEKGLQNQLAASGMNVSGRALKEAERFRQGLGAQEYGNFFNRQLAKHQQTEQDKYNYLGQIMQLAGFGPQSVNTVASAGQNTAGNVANVNTNTGNALSNIALQGGANAANIAGQRAANWNNAIQSGLSNYTAWQQQNSLNNMFNNNYNYGNIGAQGAGYAGY